MGLYEECVYQVKRPSEVYTIIYPYLYPYIFCLKDRFVEAVVESVLLTHLGIEGHIFTNPEHNTKWV